jgi:hypothetical protein
MRFAAASGLVALGLAVAVGCSLNPQPLPPDQPVDGGSRLDATLVTPDAGRADQSAAGSDSSPGVPEAGSPDAELEGGDASPDAAGDATPDVSTDAPQGETGAD